MSDMYWLKGGCLLLEMYVVALWVVLKTLIFQRCFPQRDGRAFSGSGLCKMLWGL